MGVGRDDVGGLTGDYVLNAAGGMTNGTAPQTSWKEFKMPVQDGYEAPIPVE